MADQPFHEELLLLAEKLGEVTDRLAKIEAEHTAQTAPLDAAKSAQDGVLVALNAALSGLKALNFHVLDNNLGAVSTRLSEVAKQADAAILAAEEKIAATKQALDALAADTSKKLQAVDGARTELAQKRDADAKEFGAVVSGIQQSFADLKAEFAQRIDAARKEFAEPKGFNPSGQWNSQRTYARLDVVTLNGSSFVSTEDGNREKPGKSSTKWQELARRGTANGAASPSLDELSTLATLTDAATVSWNMLQPAVKLTLGGNRTLTVSNMRAGGTYILHVIQSAGSNTLTWPSSVKWPGNTAPTLTTTAAYRDIFTFTSDGTYLFGSYVQNYAV